MTRTQDGSALNLDASDPSFSGSPPKDDPLRSHRHRIRMRLKTGQGSAFTLNAGAGGICAEQMRVPPVGTPIEGHIYLDGGDASFAGRVVWSKAGDFRLNQLGRMGVRFDRIDPLFARGLAARFARSAPAANRSISSPT
jgi:hypothetical protein